MEGFCDKASWISVEVSVGAPVEPVRHYRMRFELRTDVVRASLRFSALGVVEPWLNGARVAEDFFTPGWSDYRKRAYVSEYDVAPRLQVGANCLGMLLADGWAGAPFGPKGHAVAYAPRTMFIAELVVVYKDGESETFVTDTNWTWCCGPVIEQSIYHGETYDAREELGDWASSDGSTALDSKHDWLPVAVVPAPSIVLTGKKCEPVRITEKRMPISLRQIDSAWLTDFGQNLVGVMRVRLRNTKPGQRIVLRFAEMLQADGSLYLDNLRNAEATDVYICKGADEECYMPRFTFHGFRYAQIEGVEDGLESDDLTACILHNDLNRVGHFVSSDSIINQLQSCIVWGQRGNFLEAPTDCPQRDERLGWSGDAQAFVDTACFNYDCADFFRQWMDAMRDGQREDGAFPDTAPDILGWHGNAGWGDAGVIVPHAVWQHYGRVDIIQENWTAMCAYMDFLEQRAVEYIQPVTVYGDWLAVDAVRPEWGPTPKDLVGTAYFARDAQMMQQMARALGESALVEHYGDLAERIKAAFQYRYITRSGLVLGDTQTSYLLALGFDLMPEELSAVAGERLVASIESRDWHLSTGFLGTPLLNPVLSKIGRSDVAYRLLQQTSYPSWLYPIQNGATTMWERWNSWTQEDGFGPVEMNSFNHYAYGAIGEWLYQRVCGIAPHPEFPGYKRAILAPEPGGGMDAGGGSLRTQHGKFASNWRIEHAMTHFEFSIPRGADAIVRLPAASWSDITLEGHEVPSSMRQSSENAEQQRNKQCNICELLLPAGEYHFVLN